MKYLISIMYDGSKFHGFQRLNEEPSVQAKLEEALTIINKKPVTIKGAGRTDKGVHALDQKASFALDITIEPLNLKRALNSLVSPYIYITDVQVVDENFHARFNVIKKEYVYKINLGEYNPLLANYTYQPPTKLNLTSMKKCAKLFLGIHNFHNFVSGERENYDCIIYNIGFKKHKNILEIKFTGQSFYRYMVRNLVGAMLDVSSKKATITEIQEALEHPDVKKQFSTAMPEGLYLNKIYYKEEEI
ncbi:MAG: tRNA pseudouridine(38-40) synthase TruA [Bacilli bacterium]|nr:tRNA pseudouridine(38-40) synthase TruA [Bacilli bacterium]